VFAREAPGSLSRLSACRESPSPPPFSLSLFLFAFSLAEVAERSRLSVAHVDDRAARFPATSEFHVQLIPLGEGEPRSPSTRLRWWSTQWRNSWRTAASGWTFRAESRPRRGASANGNATCENAGDQRRGISDVPAVSGSRRYSIVLMHHPRYFRMRSANIFAQRHDTRPSYAARYERVVSRLHALAARLIKDAGYFRRDGIPSRVRKVCR